MTDDDRLQQLLRSTLTPASGERPERDLWPLVVTRMHAPTAPSWLDVSMAVVVCVLVFLFPDWLMFLAYHL